MLKIANKLEKEEEGLGVPAKEIIKKKEEKLHKGVIEKWCMVLLLPAPHLPHCLRPHPHQWNCFQCCSFCQPASLSVSLSPLSLCVCPSAHLT